MVFALSGTLSAMCKCHSRSSSLSIPHLQNEGLGMILEHTFVWRPDPRVASPPFHGQLHKSHLYTVELYEVQGKLASLGNECN